MTLARGNRSTKQKAQWRGSFSLVFLAACGVLLLAFANRASAEPNKQELHLGGIFDLTGAGVDWGEAERNGFLLAVEDFKRANPTREVLTTLEDSGYSNTKAVSALQKLTAINQTNYIIGPTWEVFTSVIPICESKKVICVAPSTNNQAFDDPKLKYSFTVSYDERDYGRVLARRVAELGKRRLALVQGTSPYYEALTGAFKQGLNQSLIFEEQFLSTERDFRTIISKIPQNLDGMVVFLLGDGQAQSFFRQWAEQRKDRPEIFTDDNVMYYRDSLDVAALGFRVEYSIPEVSSPRLKEFEDRYQQKFGEKPRAPSASFAYDATEMLLSCMAKFDPDRQQVRDCLAGTTNFSGVSGIIGFNGKQIISGRGMLVKELTH